MYVSVDKAVEKIERQVKRHRSKKQSAKRRKESAGGAPEESSEEEPSGSEEPIEAHGDYRVLVSNGFPPKPMSVEEALLQLESSDNEFQAFVNEETNEVNVVYRQKEGGYGLLRRSF